MKIQILFSLVLMSFLTSALAEVTNCKDLWKAGIPDVRYYNFNCNLKHDGNIGPADFKVYHYTDGWSEKPAELALLEEMKEAFADAYNKLSGYSGFPSVAFFLSEKDEGFKGTDAIAYALRPTDVGFCPVFIYQKILNFSSSAERKQIFAHEVIHCWQKKLYPKQMEVDYEANKWWSEGAAVYFANYVYPDVYADRDRISNYNYPDPIHRQKDPYSTASFFHSVSNNGGDIYAIMGIMSNMPQNTTGSQEELKAEQIAALHADMRSAERFHTFAQEYINNSIKDFVGNKLATNSPGVTALETVEKASKTFVRKVQAYTMDATTLRFPQGGRFKVSIKPEWGSNARGIISYRKSGTTEWTIFNPFGPLKVDTSCNGKAVDYDFLFTAADLDKMMRKIEMEIEYEDIECPCKDKLPMPACLVGKWRVENSSIDNMFSKIYGNLQGFTYLGSHGEMNIGITDTKKAAIDVPGYTVAVRKEEQYSSKYYEVEVNLDGKVNASVGVPEANKVCFKNFQGTFNNTTTISAPGMPPATGVTPIEMPNDAAGVSEYTCSGNTLVIKLPLHLRGMDAPPEIIDLVYKKVN